MIEFDVFQDGKNYAMTVSFDDGSFDEKVIGIMDKYGIKGTFFINSDSMIARGDYDRIPEIYCGHEVACHGKAHRTLNYIPRQVLVEEIFEDRKLLEAKTRYPVTGMSYACAWYSDEVISMLKNLGIVYARTGGRGAFHVPENFMKWEPTCHYTEGMEFGQKFLKAMDGWFGFPKILYVWGHGHELHNNNHWDMFEDVCRLMGGNKRIWYATNMEIFRYITAQRNLQISADESMVYNPSATRVWFSKNKKTYSVGAGETLYI